MTPDEMIALLEDEDKPLLNLALERLKARARVGIWQELKKLRQVMERWERKGFGTR